MKGRKNFVDGKLNNSVKDQLLELIPQLLECNSHSLYVYIERDTLTFPFHLS